MVKPHKKYAQSCSQKRADEKMPSQVEVKKFFDKVGKTP